eukprot:COSAG02_NODE_18397_length_941_cov_1.216152_1_plen_80_part_10
MVHRLRQRLLIPIRLLAPRDPNLRVACFSALYCTRVPLPWHQTRRFCVLIIPLRVRLARVVAFQLQWCRAHNPRVLVDRH